MKTKTKKDKKWLWRTDPCEHITMLGKDGMLWHNGIVVDVMEGWKYCPVCGKPIWGKP